MVNLNRGVLIELENIISVIEKQLSEIDGASVQNEMLAEYASIAKDINRNLYMSEEIDINALGTEVNCESIYEVMCATIPLWKQSIDRRKNNRLDSDFWSLYEYFKYVDGERILTNAIDTFSALPEDRKRLFLDLQSNYTYLTGSLNYEIGDYSILNIHVDMMKENVELFKWLYESLADYRSKKTLLGIITYWFTFDIERMYSYHEYIFKDYYDPDILQIDSNDVFVDCGAYIGDSVYDLVETYGQCGKIYAYEINPDTFEQLKANVSVLDNVIVQQKAVSDSIGKMFLGGEGAGAHVSDEGTVEISVTTLDEDINEPVTIIKMDIEGAEQGALAGAKKHITEEKPKLLICTYHKPADIFEIPKLINDMRSDYKFYLRMNGMGTWPCDYVLFAV